MSIETNLNTIATSLSSIAKSLETLVAKQAEATDTIVKTITKDKPVAAPVQASTFPTALAPGVKPLDGPVTTYEAPAASVVAAPVVPTTPASTIVATSACPFSDSKGLMTYTMGKYKELGPIKGASIQNVLTELGCKNINEVPAEKYADYYAKVEAL